MTHLGGRVDIFVKSMVQVPRPRKNDYFFLLKLVVDGMSALVEVESTAVEVESMVVEVQSKCVEVLFCRSYDAFPIHTGEKPFQCSFCDKVIYA